LKGRTVCDVLKKDVTAWDPRRDSLPGFERIDTLPGFELGKHPGIEGGTLKGGTARFETGTHCRGFESGLLARV
jgi:hypothetical protein